MEIILLAPRKQNSASRLEGLLTSCVGSVPRPGSRGHAFDGVVHTSRGLAGFGEMR